MYVCPEGWFSMGLWTSRLCTNGFTLHMFVCNLLSSCDLVLVRFGGGGTVTVSALHTSLQVQKFKGFSRVHRWEWCGWVVGKGTAQDNAKLFSKAVISRYYPATSAALRPPSQHEAFSGFWIFANLVGVKWPLVVVLFCISLVTNEIEHLFTC